MSVAMPLGQFIPGTTLIHKLDARAKFLALTLLSVALFTSSTWWGLALCAAITLLAYAVSNLSVRLVLRGLKPVLFLLIFTLLLNTIGPLKGAVPPLGISVKGYGIVIPGLIRGLFFAARIVILIIATSLLTYTTSPVALTDALVSLMRPLDKVRVPVEDIAMMFSIALRFIPTTASEADQIVIAQTARGARFNDKNLMRRIKAWIPVLVPLFVNLFRRADALAIAMEARCYQGKGRTHLRQYHLLAHDYIVVGALTIVVLVVIFWL